MATAIRYSKKREAIYQVLKNTTSHPSAEWLYQTLKPDHPDLSLGTVYRNLVFFQQQGMVKLPFHAVLKTLPLYSPRWVSAPSTSRSGMR